MPRRASCQAASEPASPAPMMVTVCVEKESAMLQSYCQPWRQQGAIAGKRTITALLALTIATALYFSTVAALTGIIHGQYRFKIA